MALTVLKHTNLLVVTSQTLLMFTHRFFDTGAGLPSKPRMAATYAPGTGADTTALVAPSTSLKPQDRALPLLVVNTAYLAINKWNQRWT